MRVLKCSLAPSSVLLNWETIAGLLGLSIAQTKWKPPHQGLPPTVAAPVHVAAFEQMAVYWSFVDEMYDEAGKLPLISILLANSLHLYRQRQGKEFSIIPQARLVTGSEYKTDYAVVIAEVRVH